MPSHWALEEEWRKYERAGASGTHRMSRKFDSVRERGATRTCDNPSRRYAGGKQTVQPAATLCHRKGLSLAGGAEGRDAIDASREQALGVGCKHTHVGRARRVERRQRCAPDATNPVSQDALRWL
jgi:hypothetical protein